MKKFTSIILVLALVMAMSVGVFAADNVFADEAAANAANLTAGTKITVAGREYTTIDDAAKITDPTGSYYLIKDIVWPEKNLGDFSGSFNGGNHKITISGDSMFGPVGGPTTYIANFTLVGEEVIALNKGFGLVGTEAHGGEFKNIVNYVGVLSNGEEVGSLFGNISSTSRSDTLVVENCVNYGLINGTQRSGGFIGAIGSISAMTNITFTNCVNHGEVRCDGNYYAGGIIGSIQGVQVESTITIENCVNNGAIYAAQSFVGGMIGGAYKANAVPTTVNFVGCTNNGDISSVAVSNMHYGTGGIFGGIDQSSVTVNANACVNNGSVTAVQIAGGIVGGISKTGSARAVKVTATNCVNTGAVTITDTGYCSAIVTSENGTANGSGNISPDSTIVVTDCLSTVADLKVNDICEFLEDGTTVVIVPEITNAVTVADAAAAVAALTGKVEDVTFAAADGKVRVTVGTHTYENSFCKDCGAPDPYNPVVLENGGGDENNGGEGETTTVPTTTTKAPVTTTAPTTTKPVDDKDEGGCKGFAAGSVAIVALMTAAASALLLKKKEN